MISSVIMTLNKQAICNSFFIGSWYLGFEEPGIKLKAFDFVTKKLLKEVSFLVLLF